MTTVGMYYDVLPGQGPTFVARFQELLRTLEASPGHQSSFLYQRVDDPESFAILSEWDSAEAFGRFVRSEAFRRVTSWGRAHILRNPPRHRIYPRADDLGRPS